MSAPPYMKLFVADFISDTLHLNRGQIGSYWLLLMAMWRAGGKLPANDAKLAQIARCSLKDWAADRDDLLALFQRKGGLITHKRLAEEIAKFEGVSEVRSEAAKEAHRKKRNKNKEQTNANAEQEQGISSHISESESDSELDHSETRAADDWPDLKNLAQVLAAEIGSPRLDPFKSPGLITTGGTIGRWKAAGASWVHDVIPVVSGKVAAAKQPITSWKYFDAAVAQAISDNRSALQIPEASHAPRSHHDAKFDARQANLSRALAGADSAARQRWEP